MDFYNITVLDIPSSGYDTGQYNSFFNLYGSDTIDGVDIFYNYSGGAIFAFDIFGSRNVIKNVHATIASGNFSNEYTGAMSMRGLIQSPYQFITNSTINGAPIMYYNGIENGILTLEDAYFLGMHNCTNVQLNFNNVSTDAKNDLTDAYENARVAMEGDLVVVSTALGDMDTILGVDNTTANDALWLSRG